MKACLLKYAYAYAYEDETSVWCLNLSARDTVG